MRIDVVTFTPEIAASYMKNNTMNRPISERRVRDYQEAMRRNEWSLNGETVKFAADGTLLDGQHRLLAIIRSGLAQQMLVVSGLHKDNFHTIDRGKARSIADDFSLMREKNAARLGGAVRAFAIVMDEGKILHRSAIQLVKISEDHPEISHVVNHISASKGKGFISSRIMGVIAYGYYLHGEHKAMQFADRLIDGVELAEKSPIRLLRERLIESKGSPNPISSIPMIVLCIKAWNAYVENRKLGVLRYSKDEVFPKMIPHL